MVFLTEKGVVKTVLCMRDLLGFGPPRFMWLVTVYNVIRGWKKGDLKEWYKWAGANERG